jgi:hypothetical protein
MFAHLDKWLFLLELRAIFEFLMSKGGCETSTSNTAIAKSSIARAERSKVFTNQAQLGIGSANAELAKKMFIQKSHLK